MHTISNEVARPVAFAPSRHGRGKGSVTALLVRSCDVGLHWLDLWRQRRALQTLDDRLLKDIGVTRADIEGELSKRFWQE